MKRAGRAPAHTASTTPTTLGHKIVADLQADHLTMKIANCVVAIFIVVDASTTPSDALSSFGSRPSSVFSSSVNVKTRRALASIAGVGVGVDATALRANAASSATAADGDNDNDGAGKSSIASASFNLIKGAVGSGVLSLPAGVAAYGDVRGA